jgi:glucose/arabinose dehydrogenase
VIEAGAGRLTRVHPDGTRETVVDGLATQIRGVSIVPVINYYADVAVAGDGSIYVTLPATGELLRVTG